MKIQIHLKKKIEKVAKEIYGADGVTYDDAATKELQHIEQMGFGNFPVCIAKTQYSLSLIILSSRKTGKLYNKCKRGIC